MTANEHKGERTVHHTAEEDFWAHDQLPKEIRLAVAHAPTKISSVILLEELRKWDPRAVLRALRKEAGRYATPLEIKRRKVLSRFSS